MWTAKNFFCVFLCVIFTTIKAEEKSSESEQKEKNLAALDIAKELISKARKLHPTCDYNDCSFIHWKMDWKSAVSTCEADNKQLLCYKSKTEMDNITEAFRLAAYGNAELELWLSGKSCSEPQVMDECLVLNIIKKDLNLWHFFQQDCTKKFPFVCCKKDCDITVTKNITKVVLLHKRPIDCSQILENGDSESGIYTIWPNHRIFEGRRFEVYCDMDTDGGGWTVIQRRGNFSDKIDFYRNWNDYKYGFGNVTQEFWIGNRNIFGLTNQADYFVRFDMETVDREHYFATYSSFWIEDENTDYLLHFGNYTGTAGDGIATVRNMKFSTKDKRNDIWGKSCTDLKQGGWWYSDCGGSNPNGMNQPGGDGAKYMNWETLKKYQSLLAIEIKIRS